MSKQDFDEYISIRAKTSVEENACISTALDALAMYRSDSNFKELVDSVFNQSDDVADFGRSNIELCTFLDVVAKHKIKFEKAMKKLAKKDGLI